MYFKKIEMQGFKSFAESVTIEFDKGITCVVGPNGSGKSNISDAIRWVLGEQSPKMLRGAKMDEVIFAGTAGRKSRGMAEVTLTIDNTDGSLDIDYQEVAITRRMYRTGESEYFINRNQCRLRDIRELIMDTGIGVDGYSIIGQGKISDILSSKTESRREIFEEAAGIVAYRTKKAEAERRLDSTTANMDRVLDIISEIDRKLPTLEEDSVKAQEYLELKERYKELEINIVLKNIEKLQNDGEILKDEVLEAGMDIENAKEAKKDADQILAECNAKNESLEKISAQTQDELLAAIDAYNKLVNKEEVDRERLSSIGTLTASLAEEIRAAEDKLSREKNNKSELGLARRDADKELAELSEVLNQTVSEYNEMSEELASLMAEVDEYRRQVFDSNAEAGKARTEINSLNMLQESLNKRQEVVLQDKVSGEDSNRDTIDKLSKLRSEKQDLEEVLEEHKEQQSILLKDGILLKADRASKSKEAETLRVESGKLAARARTLKELEDNYDGYNYAVKHVMKSNLRGIHGVVADLITVPEGFETALETALGGAIQNIVCDDDASAKAAINSLKANKAGRLTFLPVSSVRGNFRADRNAENAKGFVGFGPDCVECESRYDDIIANLLGRVVIVDTMDNAIAMSKRVGGYRFVTLDGEVISGSGAITGGKYKNKTANILDRKSEILTLEKTLEEKETLATRLQQEIEVLEGKLLSNEEESAKLAETIRQGTYELIELNNQVENAESALKAIKSGSQKLENELKNIDDERDYSLKRISEFENVIEEEEAKAKAAETAGEVKLDEYDALKEDFDTISSAITSARIDVNSCEKNMEHITEMIEKADGVIDEIEGEIEAKEARIRELNEEKRSISSGGGHSEGLITEKEAEKDRLQDYLNEINEEKAQVAKKISEATDDKTEVDEKLTELQDKKYALDMKLTRNETQLENQKEKLWDEFEVSYAQAMDFRSEEFVLSTAVKENRQIKSRLRELGEVNVGAIEEYKEEKKRFDFLTEQRDDIQSAMDGINNIIDDLDKTIRKQFKESFDKIVINFEEKFQELFGGGHAELRLSDENNPLESNIDIIAQPPGKKLQNINLLSGGEKTLTAIALMFAVLGAKPTPFCILDEVEAALDDANIDRFINCLRTLSGIQFTLVTHQKATMEHADVLYGVTMPEKGVSKVLSLAMDDDFEL